VQAATERSGLSDLAAPALVMGVVLLLAILALWLRRRGQPGPLQRQR
jgi:hypothetical protein